MMYRLLHDARGHDVTFICDEVVTGKGQTRLHTCSPQKQQLALDDSADDEGTWDDDLKQSDLDESESPKTTATKWFGASKIVLSQWPYFGTMFSSEFAEGVSGRTEIRIKDINAKTFKEMLHFLYFGNLPNSSHEVFVSDDPAKAKEASWEGLYLAAHRYRIDDLRRQALDKILERITKGNAVAFLFRSAYLFEELRVPVIQAIATVCHAEIVKKETREKYMDHPEFSELLGDIFEVYHTCREY